ncbi:hypothetical protein KC19_VG230900 [Ceratodon purpureus]|uniref:TF-B3 domain-containing protein n=1 Tax=Ceratodon purpureus TaxID=3225 RepID=A0A8T0HST8_CERPU|nr:hypothetical protein KC19_VG230900 [Ceratodon purpureus]
MVEFEVGDDTCLVAKVHPRDANQTFSKTLKPSHTRPFKSSKLVKSNPQFPSFSVNSMHTQIVCHESLSGVSKSLVLVPTQDIPVKFWRAISVDQFDGFFYGLRGPLSTTVVKTTLARLPAQAVCSFTTGWHLFVKENKLKVGDRLIFTHVDTHVFQVAKTRL